MTRTLVCILLAFVLLAGCVADEPVSDAAAGLGASSSGPPGRPHRQAILDKDFTIGGIERSGSIAVQVPQGAARLFMELNYRDGVYQDPAFTLGDCRGVTPATGLHASVGESSVNMGTIKQGVTYDCGILPAGEHAIAWRVNGILTGHITVHADIQAEQP